MAVEALLAVGPIHEKARESALLGLTWIVEAVLSEDELESATIGRFLGRLWRRQPLLPYILSARVLRVGAAAALPRRATPLAVAR